MSIFNLFRKKKEQEKEKYITPASLEDNSVESFSYDDMEDLEVINDKGDKVMLLMDDIENQFFLFNIDFKKIEKEYNYRVKDHYKIYKASGDYAGFNAIKFINNAERIDVAILDITLGTSIKLSNGDFIDIDGVDVGIKIKEKFPDAKIKFCSAHPLNRRNPDIHHFIGKWENYSSTKMDHVYFNKNSDRAKYIYDMVI